jgi:predicted ATPase/DNA-binding SARP family transcriptional activator
MRITCARVGPGASYCFSKITLMFIQLSFPDQNAILCSIRMLEVRLLGKFEIKRDGKLITISSRPAQSLFAYLILHAGTSHRREKLAGIFWPDSLEETARDNLRHALWRVRKALPGSNSNEYLLTDDLSIAFNPSADYWLDAAELGSLIESASADQLVKALLAYQGELLPGFYEEWVALEREHLSSIFERHMARLMSLLQAQNRWPDILDWAERWIKLGQKPEPAYRALMSAYAMKGDMSKVAVTYERCVQSLREFGIEPSEQTKELYKNLKSGKESVTSAPATSPPVEKAVPFNIPVPLTSFVGREQELKEIARLMSTSRLLTLTGSGGVGKTRLAIHAAHDSIKKFKDGVFWVGLVGLSDENLIPQEIAQSLNVREIPNEPLIETLKTQLKSKDLLLILDNCEHLIRACAQYAEHLLAACPKLKILATSIEALGLFNETVWQVPSLPLPETRQSLSLKELQEFASIELFDERASNAKSGFVLDERNAFSVAQICRRLDGIPLAIELAAARIKVLSAEEIAARLDDRFSLLTAGSRTAVPRHQTLRATIDWSYDLLTEPERILLRRLSVFAGGFTLEAAEVVCSEGMKQSDILELLGRLVDKSLVIVESDTEISSTRYRLLETIRQYALEKLVELGEAPAIRNQHLGFYLELAEKLEPNIFSREAAAWFTRLDREIDNIRAAMDWATNSGKADITLRIAGSLVYLWFSHGLLASDWHDRVQQALVRPEGKERTLARAKALNGIGFMYWADVYPVDRRAELEEALSIGRELGDPWNTATALRNLGLLENIRGNYQEAKELLEQSLDVWRAMGTDGRTGSAWSLIFLGDVALNLYEPERAHSLYQESVSLLKEPGDINFLAYSIRRLAHLSWREGDFQVAMELCKQSLNLNQEVGDPRGVMSCVAGFAAIAVAQGKLERGAQLMAAIEAQLFALGIRLLHIDGAEYERNLALLRAELDEKRLTISRAKGKEMSLDELIAFALEEK